VSLPSRFSSKPFGSILCPIDKMNGFMSLMFSPAFSASAFMFVSKISSVFEIFPVNSISTKSFFFVVIMKLGNLGF